MPTIRHLIRLDVPTKLHREVRIVAAARGLSMAEFARQSVANAVAKEIEKNPRILPK